MRSITIKRPDDWHIHLRDHAYLSRTVRDAARYFGRALVMPNLSPPVTDLAAAKDYLGRIQAYCKGDLEPLMTLYLTDETDADTVAAAKGSGFIHAFKLYPAGVTTNSAAGVKVIRQLYPLFESMQRHDMVLSIHGEVSDDAVDIFDREAVFIDKVLDGLVKAFPELRIVLEHITTREAVSFTRESGGKMAATVTAHHLLFNRNDMLANGMMPLLFCLPVPKRDLHRQALMEAATSGEACFFLGTDSAPHPRHAKESACGCAAGCYTAHAAIELYAEVFAGAGKLDRLQGFASEYGADFYGLPRNEDELKLCEKDWRVPRSLAFGEDDLLPIRGGQSIAWQVETGARYPLSDSSS